MKNKMPKGIFVVDNKEASLKAIERIKKLLTITLSQVKALKENNKTENLDTKKLCEAIIKNINLLIDTIDKSRKTSISKDLDYLYKHCLFSVIRVRDNEDFDFLDGCVNVLSDITEGWERVDLSIKKAPAFG
tara:strand:+ start:165 stop:560 length:396 start_codon:yes stop_codon:yes gene_type:complete